MRSVEMNGIRARRPIIFGEILVDIYPDGRRTLGGAALNVGWHLRGLGLDPILVSGVGDDSLGKEVLEGLDGWGMDLSGVQVIAECPTGCVRIFYDDKGEPRFQCELPQPFDLLDFHFLEDILIDGSILYHGSYIARTERSRSTLGKIRELRQMPSFMDVNLRDPYWNRALVLKLVRGSAWAKFSLEELATIVEEESLDWEVLEYRAEELRTRLETETLVVSAGARGALLSGSGGAVYKYSPGRIEEVDTVGAGDAQCAVLILGIESGWSEEVILQRAVAFATATCGFRGAVSSGRGFYETWRSRWCL